VKRKSKPSRELGNGKETTSPNTVQVHDAGRKKELVQTRGLERTVDVFVTARAHCQRQNFLFCAAFHGGHLVQNQVLYA
jgi:hypothetical protein